MVLAERGIPNLWLVLGTLLGGAMSAGSANAFNMYIDRDIDRLMGRTQNRPLVTGEVTPRAGALVASAAALALAAPFLASAQDIKPRIIRFGYGLNEQSNQGRAVKVFAERVEKASGGKMKVRAIGAAALGSDNQMQQALIGGAQEMMVGSTATLVGITKEMALWDTPFLINNAKEADVLLDGPIGKKVIDKLQEKGLVGLVYWENGFRNLTNSKRPINKLEDLNGIKLRVMQNNVFLDSFKSLGTNAVPLAFSELFSALETGTVDGQENPVNTILSSKFYEVQKFLSVTNHVYTSNPVVISKKVWDRMSAEEHKLLQDAVTEAGQFERKLSRETAQQYRKELAAKGMQINDVPAATVVKMQELTKPTVEKFSASYDPTLVNLYRSEMERIRKAIP